MSYQREYYRSTEHFTCDITPKRVVPTYELEIYDYGTGFASIDNVLYPHRDNMVIFAKPDQERFTIGSFSCYAIHFSCDDQGIREILNAFPDCITIDRGVKNQLIGYYESAHPTYDLQTVSSIMNILNTVKKSSHIPHSETQPIPKRIVQVKEYIDRNYQSRLEPSELQEIADLSINYIRKQFSDHYGITIQKYITELRLSYVKKLLISTDMSVCDIAYEAGFNSQAHMNYMFKTSFGISPLKYKSKFTGNIGNAVK